MRLAKAQALAMASAIVLATVTIPAVASSQNAPAAAASGAAPQNTGPLSESVAAVVNDDVISTYDVLQRMRLLMVTSGVQPTAETLPQIQAEALRALVDERLQIQELRRVEKAQKYTIVSTEKEIDEQIDDIARSNNTTRQQLLGSLTAQGVGAETFRQQLRAESSWQSWINGRYGSRLRIGEDQVKAFERRYNETQSKPQYDVMEVFLDANRVGGMAIAANGANQLVAQLQQGAPFAAVARQFSASPTAANGGDAGWIAPGVMPPEVDAALEQLRPGQLSAPIPVKDGIYIVYLRDKRSGAQAALVNLKQAAVGLPQDATPAQVDAARAKLETLRPLITGCDTLDAAAAKVDGVLTSDLGETEIKDLAPAFQEAANTLAVGQISQPIRTGAGLHLVAVCGKRATGANAAPSTAQIENRLRGEQLALISRRYLRDLRNSATIETR
jgi:peptidyl-prolyl cis-trans isomerase SurA